MKSSHSIAFGVDMFVGGEMKGGLEALKLHGDHTLVRFMHIHHMSGGKHAGGVSGRFAGIDEVQHMFADGFIGHQVLNREDIVEVVVDQFIGWDRHCLGPHQLRATDGKWHRIDRGTITVGVFIRVRFRW